jgi:hypothetical protein
MMMTVSKPTAIINSRREKALLAERLKDRPCGRGRRWFAVPA